MPSTQLIPTGTILPYAGDLRDVRVVDRLHGGGWLPCFGQTVPVAAYPLLYDQIVNVYGGDSQNFALPDLRGLFVRGVDDAHPLASVQPYRTAAPAVAFTTDTVPAHTHSLDGLPTQREGTIPFSGFNQAEWNEAAAETSAVGDHQHTIVSGGDRESRPINVYLDFIIKAD